MRLHGTPRHRVIPKCHFEMFFGPRRPPHRAVQTEPRSLTELDGRLDDQAGEHVDLERLVDGGLHGRHLAAEVGLLHHRGVLVFPAGRWRSQGQVRGSGARVRCTGQGNTRGGGGAKESSCASRRIRGWFIHSSVVNEHKYAR